MVVVVVVVVISSSWRELLTHAELSRLCARRKRAPLYAPLTGSAGKRRHVYIYIYIYYGLAKNDSNSQI